MKKALLSVACLLLVGCSGVKQLGAIGSTKYYQVKSQSIVGPNITMIVSENAQHELRNETSASCTGIGASAVNAAGNVGASAVFGLSLKRDNYSNTVNGGGAEVTATGGSGTSSASGSGSVQSTSTGGDYTRINGNSANAPGHNKH